MKQTCIWQKNNEISQSHWELLSPEEKAKYLRALDANANSGLLRLSYDLSYTKTTQTFKKMFNKITVIFRVYVHTIKLTGASWWSLKCVNRVIARMIVTSPSSEVNPSPRFITQIKHCRLYDKTIHTLGYNLTVQKHMSGFKTHQTAPAAKGIHVWIVFVLMTFMNVY